MENTIKLTAQQLFYLATLMDAEFIDYSYVSAMGNVGDSFRLFESRVRNELVDAGILSEDFNGEVEIIENVRKLLEPVCRSFEELTVDIIQTGDAVDVVSYHFHLKDDCVTMIYGADDFFNLCDVSTATVKEVIQGILPNDYSAVTGTLDKEIEEERITRIVSVKSVVPDGESVVEVFFEYDGKMCKENEDDQVVVLDKEAFIDECMTALQGVI